ncbi:cellulose synthase (UDP-forming) [Ranunculus cassubicifolius]
MMLSGVPLSCGEEVGYNKNGEVFVACIDFEIKEGKNGCLRCAAPYTQHNDLETPAVEDLEMGASGNRTTLASHLHGSQWNSQQIFKQFLCTRKRVEC